MSVFVRMKDGRVHCGDLWTWRPREGWFEMVGVGIIQLNSVEFAVNRGVRCNATGETRDIDLLERARDEGWEG